MSSIHIRGFCNDEQLLTCQKLRCCNQRKDLAKKVGFIFEKVLDFRSLLWYVVVLTEKDINVIIIPDIAFLG